MQKLRWLAILMGIAILAITGFQVYWLKNNYDREEQTLAIKTNAAFRQTILKLQASKLKFGTINLQWDSIAKPGDGKIMMPPRRKNFHGNVSAKPGKEEPITLVNLMQEKMKELGPDTSGGDGKAIIFSGKGAPPPHMLDSLRGAAIKNFNTRVETISISSDSLRDPAMIKEMRVEKGKNAGRKVTVTYGRDGGKNGKPDSLTLNTGSSAFIDDNGPVIIRENMMTQNRMRDDLRKDAVFRFLYNVDSVSLKDSVTLKEVDSAYTTRLKEEKMMALAFTVSRPDSSNTDSSGVNEVTIGFAKPITYHLTLDNKVSYVLKKLTLPILFSFFLVGITVLSFVLLYRNLVKQRRLAELKNEFISNITHELKTPIATVGVAIEALQNFNALHDPQRTKEYLDISKGELQRLSLLVDKVLKLSMFEKKEMELKKEQFDCKQLAEEVMSSMRLQFEKYHAKVKLHTEGDNFIVEADKLHITSVIYNLLDNALKYSRENPVINVELSSHPDHISFSVSDNGIGIAPAYKEKVFDKFFRVPTGDKHNTKGYGLGLSYVSEVLKRHQGNVHVESELGKGSTFTAKFPYA